MIDPTVQAPVQAAATQSVADELRAQLIRGDAAAASVAPILRHILAMDDEALVSEEIVARVRGMLADLAVQLLDHPEAHEGEISALGAVLARNAALLAHVHAIALEWQLVGRLHATMALDHVLSPLMQSLVGSEEPAVSALAMKVLAAQARFCQAQRRMQLPLEELPGDLFHIALVSLRAHAADYPGREALAAERDAAARRGYDEGATRLCLLSRFVGEMGGDALSALSVAHAGLAIFLSAVAIGSGINRDLAALSAHGEQAVRLALALRAAGLDPARVEEQLVAIHGEARLPADFAYLDAQSAAFLLAERSPVLGS